MRKIRRAEKYCNTVNTNPDHHRPCYAAYGGSQYHLPVGKGRYQHFLNMPRKPLEIKRKRRL